MKNLIFALLLALLPLLSDTAAATQAPSRFAVAEGPTPVLNTPSFTGVFGGTIRLDPCRGMRPIEFVALPGTLFRIDGELENDGVTVYRVTSRDYPYTPKTGYYVDARFVRTVDALYPERPRPLPELAEMQQRLVAALGKPYVWGGNLKDGVPLLGKFYPQADTLAGVDCSGLLYEATGGYTPRNSSALTVFGAGVPIAGLSAEGIAARLRPLDLIVWMGHVMVVLDSDRVIQSTMGCKGEGGVRLSPLKETLRRLMKSRKPLDHYPEGGGAGKAFVIRRWFPR